MITYNKIGWGLPLLFRMYGSSFPRSFPPAAVSAGITALFYLTIQQNDQNWWRHPYPYQVFAYIVGFIVIFRSNFGYQRYWDGRTWLQNMTAAWVDACIQEDHEDSDSGLERFRHTCFHLFSLLHALCIQHLRTDWDLNNLRPHLPSELAPPVDAAALRGNGSKHKHGLGQFSYWDVLMLRGSDGKRQAYNRNMPLLVIGGISPAEAAILGEGKQAQGYLEVATLYGGIDRRGPDHSHLWHVFGLTTGMYVPGAAERVAATYTWLQQVLQERATMGGLGVPPPVLANMYRSLTEGYRAFQSCRTLVDTPFPFPWSQLVLMLLLVFSLTCPLLIVSWIEPLWLGVVLDFFCVQTYWALNEVARDLEDPYVYEPNDLPLARLQYQFNKRLMAVAHAHRPDCLMLRSKEPVPAMDMPSTNNSAQSFEEPRI